VLSGVGERLPRQGYVWPWAEAEDHFDKEQMDRLLQVLGIYRCFGISLYYRVGRGRIQGADEP
jgi:hypothetical protein